METIAIIYLRDVYALINTGMSPQLAAKTALKTMPITLGVLAVIKGMNACKSNNTNVPEDSNFLLKYPSTLALFNDGYALQYAWEQENK